MAKAKVSEVLAEFRKEIPGFISSDIVSLADGISIGGGSVDPRFDSSVASAYYANVMTSTLKTVAAIDPKIEVEDFLITTEKMIVLIRILKGSDYCHLLAASHDSNLGICRLVLKKYEPQFISAL
jgi:predicted regulator of Ras-like GTPase activity (Roadblock/LC7/MglB family)